MRHGGIGTTGYRQNQARIAVRAGSRTGPQLAPGFLAERHAEVVIGTR
jgi:hypothetical protein